MYPSIQNLLISSSPDGIIAFDTQLTITAWNPVMEQIFEIKEEDLLEKKITDPGMPAFLSGSNAEFFYEALKGNSATISTIHFKGGTDYNFFEITYFPLLASPGDIKGGVAQFKEIKLSADLSRLSSKTYIQFQDVLENMTDAFVAMDSNWCYTYVNRKAALIFNRTQEYLIGKHIWTEFPEGIGQPFYRAYYRAVEENTSIILEEYYPPYDRWFENRIHPLKDGIAIFFSDVTDKKKETEHLQQLNNKLNEQNNALTAQEEELVAQQEYLKSFIDELRERNFELDQIIYKISHDIRAPLVSILGLLEIIKLEKDQAQIKNYHDFIENRVKKLDDFVKSMLNFSRINRTEVKLATIDFNELIEQCFQHLKYLNNFERIEKRVTVDGGPFRNDALRIEIIFINIFSNAIKYLNPYHESPYIQIDIKIDRNQAQIMISDNGIGIKAEYLDKIFDMFFRGTEKSEGSGIGLYIVKQTMDKLGGVVEIKSTEGEKTEILLIIPNKL